jgi:hypothetical protein
MQRSAVVAARSAASESRRNGKARHFAQRFCFGVDTALVTARLFSMRGSHSVRTISPKALSIVGLLLAALHPSSARAEVSVQGTAADVRVEARDATVADILAALGQHFELRFRGLPADRRVTGVFEGPLRRVISRVLEGCDYVIQRKGDAIEVLVLNAAQPTTGAAATAPPAIIAHRHVE